MEQNRIKRTFIKLLNSGSLTATCVDTTCCKSVATKRNLLLTMETEEIFVFLWSRGDLDDGDGEAVGGRGEDS